MPQYRYCAVYNCSHSVKPKCRTNYPGKLHSFPNSAKNPDVYESWVRFCGRGEGWKPTQTDFICGVHFVSKKGKFFGTEEPMLPANLMETSCENTENIPSHLPLDSSFQCNSESFLNTTLSSPKKYHDCLPLDQTLDSNAEDGESSAEVIRSSIAEFYESAFPNVALAKCPPGWKLVLDSSTTALFAEIDEQTTDVTRSVGIKSNGGILAKLLGKDYEDDQFDDFYPLHNLQHVEKLLRSVAEVRLCANLRMRAPHCGMICESSRKFYCPECSRIERRENDLVQLRKEVTDLDTKLEQAIPVTDDETSSLLYQFLLIRRKNKFDRTRYNKYILEVAVNIMYHSPAAYEYLRGSLKFPLPHRNTIMKITGMLSGRSGFVPEVKEILKAYSAKLPPHMRYVSIMWDEMSIKSCCFRYLKHEDRILGLVDYGVYGSKLTAKEESQIADHALVVSVQSLSENTFQPIAYFFTHTTVKATALAQIIEAAVGYVDESELTAVCFVCEGGTSNGSAFKVLGVLPGDHKVTVRGKKIYIIYDPVHNVKCSRNGFLHKDGRRYDGKGQPLRFVDPDGSYILAEDNCHATLELSHFQLLYAHDNKVSREGLKLHPKLKEKDVYPDKFSVQKTNGATHLFSETCVRGLEKLEEQGLAQYTIATRKYALLMNELFDVLNTSRSDPKSCRQPIYCYEKHRLERLEATRKHLVLWRETRLFSKIRYRGGRCPNPNLENFIAACNCCTLHSVIHIGPRTNQEPGGDENPFSGAETIQLLKTIKKELETEDLPDEVYFFQNDEELDEAELVMPDELPEVEALNRQIVYYLGGFSTYRRRVNTKLCFECQDYGFVSKDFREFANPLDSAPTASKDHGGLEYCEWMKINLGRKRGKASDFAHRKLIVQCDLPVGMAYRND
ncbi:hypothetical protein RvY_15214 [Ramazzottius varieornatus]|uniref:THAP-type domain-containing protein n=1 Tax=Ramazzottius varieornatus TaxID=947166 RepID=A0A1D1VVR0_RAMVA|nr:hypothetical protein RvY_15214 [Ramazzottius varieornatus]